MLTGKLPFTGPSPLAAMNDRLLNHPMPPPSPTLPSLRSSRKFSIDPWRGPQNRYPNAHAFLHDLQHLDQVGVEDRDELKNWQRRKSQLSRKILYYGALAMVPWLFCC